MPLISYVTPNFDKIIETRNDLQGMIRRQIN